MKFSVIIPVYNGENFIGAAVRSVLGQTYGDVELIVVNDGSTDDTEEAVLSAFSEYPNKNAVYKRVKNGGPSAARNLGLDLATGDYVSFLDADDEYDTRLFEELALTIGGADICFWGWKERKGGKEVFCYTDTFSYPSEDISGEQAAQRKASGKIWLCNCNEAYSLKMLKDASIYYLDGVSSGEDANFIYKSLSQAKCVRALKKEYFINNIRDDSLMHSEFSDKCLTEFTAGKDLYEYAVATKKSEALCDLYFSLYYASKIYVAKRLVKSLRFCDVFRFGKTCKTKFPKIKKERKIVLSRKKKFELALFKIKPLFFCFYKAFYAFKKV